MERFKTFILFKKTRNSLVCETDLVSDDASPEVRGLKVDIKGGALAEYLVLQHEAGHFQPLVSDPVTAHLGIATI